MLADPYSSKFKVLLNLCADFIYSKLCLFLHFIKLHASNRLKSVFCFRDHDLCLILILYLSLFSNFKTMIFIFDRLLTSVVILSVDNI
jgi:hypothetical protein